MTGSADGLPGKATPGNRQPQIRATTGGRGLPRASHENFKTEFYQVFGLDGNRGFVPTLQPL
jgi:hypothetical protein